MPLRVREREFIEQSSGASRERLLQLLLVFADRDCFVIVVRMRSSTDKVDQEVLSNILDTTALLRHMKDKMRRVCVELEDPIMRQETGRSYPIPSSILEAVKVFRRSSKFLPSLVRPSRVTNTVFLSVITVQRSTVDIVTIDL